MGNLHGDHVWYELMTPDPRAAAEFYGKVIGWTAEPGDNGYRHLKAGDTHIGGMLSLTGGMAAGGARPGWLGYVGVHDVDDAVTSIEHGGGRVLMPAQDLTNVGRIALVADPQGAPFYVIRSERNGASTAFAQNQLGHCAWNELSTTEPEQALHFYASRFGWLKGDVMPMGDMGDYQFITHGGATIGAVMRSPPGRPALWQYYFTVADAGVAAEATGRNGGSVLHGPQEIPSGDRIVIATDPQGATFAVVGK